MFHIKKYHGSTGAAVSLPNCSDQGSLSKKNLRNKIKYFFFLRVDFLSLLAAVVKIW